MAKLPNDNRNDSFGGLKAGNLNEINSKFICPICHLILIQPWQLLCCGGLLCSWCLKHGLSNSEPFTCQLCGMKQPKKEALPDRGAERELKAIIIVCYSCSWNGLYNDYLDHLQELHADFECIDCHEHFFAINSFEEHRQELCIHRCIPCGLPDCMNSIKWYDMKVHYLTGKHQRILLIIIAEYIHPNHQQLQTYNRSEMLEKEYHDIQESISIILSAIDILFNDLIRLNVEISQMKTNIEPNISKINELKKQDDENEQSVKKLIETLNGTQIQLDSIKKIRDESEILILDTNCTITLSFNYPNTSSFSLNSLKFKTSQYGYTFMLRVCSTIESTEEYLSIFLTLYHGEYDNLISYPFLYDIHLVLWDQSNQQKHILYILKPDLNSSSVDRPISEKNNEYGIVKFCSLRYLTDSPSIYVNDGTFFIRVFIDFLNTGENPFQLKNNNQDMATTMITD